MTEETQVIICGGGPTGAILSALLSRLRVPNVVLEREANITTDPRGIALDEDGIRVLQAIGVYEKIFTEMASSMLRFNFVTGVHSDFYKTPMCAIDNSTSEGGTGHVGFICHKQPEMERAIRSSIESSRYSQLRSSSLVTGISEDEDSVTVHYTTADGDSKAIKGKFLVGADGKTGFVRKNYLEPRGITLDRCEGTNYDEIWVALNWKINLPTQETHPDFPLWKCGYTPTQVYDFFFPKEFRFLCNPKRPAVCGRFGLESDRLWRFEFVVYKNEDGTKMASREETMKIILPYLTHPGHRFGLDEPVQFPVDCIEILRSRPFSFQARSCNKWAQGRVILAGDAAHVFPPFGGQGIASGFRDALGLAWRLALLYMEPSANYVSILEAWYLERKQQFERSLAMTIRNGDLVNQSNPFKVFLRDWFFWLVQLSPAWKREIEKGHRAQGMTRYTHRPGLPFLAQQPAGKQLPQVYVRHVASSKLFFSDDLVFTPEKKSLFQLLILPDSFEEAARLVAETKGVQSNKFLSVDEATVIIQAHQPESDPEKQPSLQTAHVARLATGEEFAADAILCRNRPEPKYYDPYRLRQDLGKSKYVLVRPDRIVYAACDTATELVSIVDDMSDILLLKT